MHRRRAGSANALQRSKEAVLDVVSIVHSVAWVLEEENGFCSISNGSSIATLRDKGSRAEAST